MTALKYLKNKEWSMGNGQCPECCGVPSSWHGNPTHLTAETIGHEKGCLLAASIRDIGGETLMVGDFDGPDYETYWNDNGLLSTRLVSSKA